MASRSPKLAKIDPGAFGIPGGKVTETALTLPKSMSYKAWAETGALLGRVARAHQWWVADWVNHGEDTYGEKFAQALDVTGSDEKTLLNWSRVAKAVDPSRRRAELTFTHHEVVSVLNPEDQAFWLDKAVEGDELPNQERERWSSRRLRAELKKLDQPAVAAEVEVELVDKAQVPLDYLVLDVHAIREAYKAGTTEIPGVAIKPPSAAPAVEEPAA